MQLQLQKVFEARTLHTGQHYDDNMSRVFFEGLNIPKPDYQINIGGSRPQGEQTAIMLTEIEKVCMQETFDVMLVYGDTNSTLAGALVASKMDIPLVHIEAGLRSFNRKMPEEINRIVADNFSDLLFCPTEEAVENLSKEGIHQNIHVTGDVMCDMIHLVKDQVIKLENDPYIFATIHRPYNTDDKDRIFNVFSNLNKLGKKVILPLHPRTIARLQTFEINIDQFENLKIIDPIGYIESISYQTYADAIVTDSGGMQKEAYILKKKCVTLRSETEWTETLSNGWNHLVFDDLSMISNALQSIPGAHQADLYGNGHAAHEIVEIIYNHFQ